MIIGYTREKNIFVRLYFLSKKRISFISEDIFYKCVFSDLSTYTFLLYDDVLLGFAAVWIG
jgi:hypothetical protein